MFKNTSIGFRLIALGVASFLILIVITGTSLWTSYSARFEDRRETLRLLVQTATSEIAGYKQKVADGSLSIEDAKQAALTSLSNLKYGDGNYFIVLDKDGILLMHPTRTKQIGTSMVNASGSGHDLYRALLSLAKDHGAAGGFHTAMGRRPGSTTNDTPKMFLSVEEPSFGWVVITGLFVNDIRDNLLSQLWFVVGITALGLAALAVLTMTIGRSIAGPLKRILRGLEELADGDYEHVLQIGEGRSEIGRLVSAFNNLRNLLRTARDDRLASDTAKADALEQRRREMLALSDRFESQVGGLAEQLGAASASLSKLATDMSQATETTIQQAETVASAAAEASTTTETVAAATEELATSIQEISHQASQSNLMSQTAVERVLETNDTVSALQSAAQKVGDVVALITDIANQTNLLALNATIEAARAGDAGKGFAVVAGEVKSLAQQTARATEDISKQIEEIQTVTGNTVTAITSIGETINKVSAIAAAIAAAVEEQNAATVEISKNIQMAEHASRQVSESIAKVHQAAETSGTTSREVLGSAETLLERNRELDDAVSGFLGHIRGAQ